MVAYFTLQESYVNIANLPLPGFGRDRAGAARRASRWAASTPSASRVIGIPSFIMTLAMMQIGAGICAMLVRGQIAYAVPDARHDAGLGHDRRRSRAIVIVAGLFLLVGHLVLTYTRFGRYVYMVGGNREAAEYSGVNVKLVIAAVMVISAVCSGVAGMLGVAYFGSAQQNEFDGYLLNSISAVVVGGTSLFGGRGGIGNTIIGLFVLGVLNNGLDHVDIDSFLKILIRGLILLAGAGHQRLRPEVAPAGVTGRRLAPSDDKRKLRLSVTWVGHDLLALLATVQRRGAMRKLAACRARTSSISWTCWRVEVESSDRAIGLQKYLAPEQPYPAGRGARIRGRGTDR